MLTYRLSPKNRSMFLFIYPQQMVYIPRKRRGVTFICEAPDEGMAASEWGKNKTIGRVHL
ncbi:hypothetical protein [Cohnella silvisoli]|uniref:Uncharacterized protein n=1 Tax=Cohnella silvisoli TaxID=2873699 RepID=A0ABV1L2G4_9BACL|nr:hypothetical protein [Cohnella silvisoli]